jgi:hypothetical protein
MKYAVTYYDWKAKELLREEFSNSRGAMSFYLWVLDRPYVSAAFLWNSDKEKMIRSKVKNDL